MYRHPKIKYIYGRKRPAFLERLTSGDLKRFGYMVSAAGLLVSIAAANLFFLMNAQAAVPYNASDVLGQMDPTFNPEYTTGSANHVPVGNFAGNYFPNGMTLDSVHHRLFISGGCDFSSRILVYQLDSSNHLTSNHADYVLGQPDFATCDFQTNANYFCDAYHQAYDSVNDKLFVADECHGRVLVFNLSGGITNGMAASNVLGKPDFTTSSSFPAAQNNIRDVESITYDSANQRLFVADDTWHRVLVFNLSGGITNGMNAANVLGQANFTTSGFGLTQSTLHTPTGLAYDSNHTRLFVGDNANRRVMVFNLGGGIVNGMNASFVLGQANFTSNAAASPPTQKSVNFGCGNCTLGMDYDVTNNRMMLADTGNNRVLIFDGNSIATNMNASNVLGQANFTSNGFANTQNTLSDPNIAIYDSTANRIYVADGANNRVLIFDASTITNGMNAIGVIGQNNGPLSPSFTTGDNDFNGSDYGYYSASYMDHPEDTLLDTVHHRLFIVDPGNTHSTRILVYQLDGSNNITKHHADYVLGKPNFTSKCTFSPDPLCAASQNNLIDPEKIAYDPNHDRLFVVDNQGYRVMVYDFSGGISNGMNASFVIGQPNFTSTTPALSQSGLNWPWGAAYDANNNRLFVADNNNERVMVFDGNNLSNGMNASFVLGQPDFTSSSFGDWPNQFSQPMALGYDQANNRLFIAVNDNLVSGGATVNTVIYNLSTGISNGMDFDAGFSPNGGTFDFEFDSSQDLVYVAEGNRNRVGAYQTSQIESGFFGNIQPIAALGNGGVNDFSFPSGGTSQSRMKNPSGLALDATKNRIYVSDSDNSRVMVYDLPKLVTSLPNGNTGNAYNVSTTSQTQGIPSTEIMAGALPPGLSLNIDTGVISGTPTAAGSYSVTIRVDDSAGSYALASDFINTQTYCLHISDPSGSCGGPVPLAAYQAMDLIGQINGLDQPIWGQSLVDNNSGGPNAKGLNYATATAIDSVHHRLFVGDTYNNRVLVFNLDANDNLIDHTADHVIGQPDFTSNGGGLSANQVDFGSDGYTSLAYDSVHDRLFVADPANNRVLVFNTGTITDGMNANKVLGQSDFISNTANLAQDGLDAPRGVGYDGNHDRLFISDTNNYRVLVFNTGTITDGMNASKVLGQPDFVTNTFDYDVTTLNSLSPSYSSPVYDAANDRLFVASSDESRVLVFDVTPAALTNGKVPDHVLGEPDFTSQSFGLGAAAMSFPEAIAYDPVQHLLFVEDYSNDRIMIFNADPATLTNGQSAVGVLSQVNFISNDIIGVLDNTYTSQDKMSTPDGTGMAYDPLSHRLYAPDPGNNRIMVYGFAHLASPAPGGTTGVAYNFNAGTQIQGNSAHTITSGSLPNSLSLSSATGVISGTPSLAGTFNFSLHVTDGSSSLMPYMGTYFDDASYSINIASGGDNTAPSTPTGLAVTAVTTTTVSLNWSASTDNVGVTGYNIYRNGGVLPVGTVAGTSFTDSGLTAGTTYSYTITAFDAANNESTQSTPANGTTSTSGGNSPSPPSSPSPASSNGPAKNSSSPPSINLDAQPSFADGSGYITKAVAGQTFTFTLGSGDTTSHTINVIQVLADRVILSIDQQPKVELALLQQITKDVDSNGRDDIGMGAQGIYNSQATVKFWKISLAASTNTSSSNGFGAGAAAAPIAPHHPGGLLHRIPELFLLIFPWLLFALLGLTAATFAWQTLNERRRAAVLAKQIERGKSLADQKHNFITLSSHYFRTPLTLVSNGIELLASLGAEASLSGELKQIGQKLKANVDLMLQAVEQMPSLSAEAKVSAGNNASQTLVKRPRPAYITGSLLGIFAAVVMADYILIKVDLYDLKFINILIQLAAMLLAAVLLFSGYRSRQNYRQLHENNKQLLNGQRQLDKSRNDLIKDSLQSLSAPLSQIKSKLKNINDPKMAKPALEGVGRFEAMLQKFTIVASLEAGSMEVLKQPMDLNSLVANVTERYNSVLQQKGITIKTDVKSPQVYQDSLLLSFALDVVINNAIKYSPGNHDITITGTKHGNKVRITVADQGPGIPQSKLAELFQPFSRVEDAAKDFDQQGMGLGLYLDKLIMAYLGGDIEVQSSPKGTAMKLELPFSLSPETT